MAGYILPVGHDGKRTAHAAWLNCSPDAANRKGGGRWESEKLPPSA